MITFLNATKSRHTDTAAKNLRFIFCRDTGLKISYFDIVAVEAGRKYLES